MDITDLRSDCEHTLCELDPGDPFEFQSEIFILTDIDIADGDLTAVNVYNGNLKLIDHMETITPLCAEFVINNEGD